MKVYIYQDLPAYKEDLSRNHESELHAITAYVPDKACCATFTGLMIPDQEFFFDTLIFVWPWDEDSQDELDDYQEQFGAENSELNILNAQNFIAQLERAIDFPTMQSQQNQSTQSEESQHPKILH